MCDLIIGHSQFIQNGFENFLSFFWKQICQQTANKANISYFGPPQFKEITCLRVLPSAKVIEMLHGVLNAPTR